MAISQANSFFWCLFSTTLGKSPLCLETRPLKRRRSLTSRDVLGPRTGATVPSSLGAWSSLMVSRGPPRVPGRSLQTPPPPQRPFRVGEGVEWGRSATAPVGLRWEWRWFLASQPASPSLLLANVPPSPHPNAHFHPLDSSCI